MPPGLIVALDTADKDQALAWAEATASFCSMVKVGLEFFLSHGHAGVRMLSDAGHVVMLDLKLHDVPTTVARAVRAVLPLKPHILTVHASGGAAMIEAARGVIEKAPPPRPLLIAVTVLTSLDTTALQEIGMPGSPDQHVLAFAGAALRAGADGLVCSAYEIPTLRRNFGNAPLLVVPGIRVDGAEQQDQKRSMTPGAAARAGADWIVVGRPITGAPDPAMAAAGIAAEVGA